MPPDLFNFLKNRKNKDVCKPVDEFEVIREKADATD